MLRKIKLLYWQFLQWRHPDNLPCKEEAREAAKLLDAIDYFGMTYVSLVFRSNGLTLEESRVQFKVYYDRDMTRERIRQLILKGINHARRNPLHGSL